MTKTGNTENNQYDVVPYDSHPFSKTHPENLCTIARLFGVAAPDHHDARILELGCGQGGNLLPLAYNLPHSRCLGIDLSARQIEPGQQIIKALGLTNIALRQMSITDIGPDLGQFDYIICHGVYSWVPTEVRDKILSVCRDHLAATGVAYISYNCLPGWHMIHGIRDMMLYHVADFNDPAEKAEQARTMLRFILDSQGREDSAYAAHLQSELDLLSAHRDAYLLHDHLEENNHPIYFHQFVANARRFGLDYLGETDLHTMFADNLGPVVAEKICQIRDIVKAEQYMDFIRNRRFRCTLLCHDDARIERNLHVEDIERFFITSLARPEAEVCDGDMEDGAPVVFTGGNISVTVRGRIPKIAMLILAAHQHKPLAYSDLCAETIARSGIVHPQYIREQINADLNLLRLMFAGLIRISLSAGDYITEVRERPVATRLVRHQASLDETVTNQQHRSVRLNPAEQVLIRYLDGRRNIDALAREIVRHVIRGDLILERDGIGIDDPAERLDAAGVLCRSILKGFADKALLVERDR